MNNTNDLRLLVTLHVKPEQFNSYLIAMQAEVAGARSEAGNLGFDLFEDAVQPNTIYLFEHWVSRAALEQDHADQPYYIYVRGLEAQALTGEFEERVLQEIHPHQPQMQPNGKSMGGTSAQALILQTAEAGVIEKLDSTFAQAAAALRSAAGCCGLLLFSNETNPQERVLIDAWDNAAAREAAWSQEGARNLTNLLASAPWSKKTTIGLIDRGNDY